MSIDSVKINATLQQLLLYFHDLCSDRKQTDSIYLDFNKAFESFSHTQLTSVILILGTYIVYGHGYSPICLAVINVSWLY